MDKQGVYSYNPSTNEILFRLNPICKCNREVVGVLNEQQAEIERLQKIIDLTNYQLKVQDRIIQEMEEKE